MANKPLPSPEGLRQLLRYEPETGHLFWLERPASFFPDVRRCNQWNARCAGKRAFASSHGDGYLCGKLFGRVHLAHRIAWAIHHGKWPDHEIDHEDGRRSNNAIGNLRPATDGQNAMNSAARRGGSSQYVGVYFDKRINRWRAVVQCGKRRRHLGTFMSEVHAARARDEEALKMHGEFARLNFPKAAA